MESFVTVGVELQRRRATQVARLYDIEMRLIRTRLRERFSKLRVPLSVIYRFALQVAFEFLVDSTIPTEPRTKIFRFRGFPYSWRESKGSFSFFFL